MKISIQSDTYKINQKYYATSRDYRLKVIQWHPVVIKFKASLVHLTIFISNYYIEWFYSLFYIYILFL